MAEKCGCKVEGKTAVWAVDLIDEKSVTWTQCSLHAAASEMLEALEKAKAAINNVYGHHCFTAGLQSYIAEGLRNVVAAIAKAKSERS